MCRQFSVYYAQNINNSTTDSIIIICVCLDVFHTTIELSVWAWNHFFYASSVDIYLHIHKNYMYSFDVNFSRSISLFCRLLPWMRGVYRYRHSSRSSYIRAGFWPFVHSMAGKVRISWHLLAVRQSVTLLSHIWLDVCARVRVELFHHRCPLPLQAAALFWGSALRGERGRG